MNDTHQQTVDIYNRHAAAWDQHRPRVLVERPWLDKFIALLPTAGQILDAGCGAGEPIARYLLERGFSLTGIDASVKMLEIVRSRFAGFSWLQMDMRDLDLGERFDGIVSWDAFFHLNQPDQRRVIPLFADHLTEQGVLLLTIGHEAGEVTGIVEGDEVYHASLDADEYREILQSLGFTEFEIKLQDASCDYHSILLARRSG